MKCRSVLCLQNWTLYIQSVLPSPAQLETVHLCSSSSTPFISGEFQVRKLVLAYSGWVPDDSQPISDNHVATIILPFDASAVQIRVRCRELYQVSRSAVFRN